MFSLLWIVFLAIFKIRGNTWPWSLLKATGAFVAVMAGVFGIMELDTRGIITLP